MLSELTCCKKSIDGCSQQQRLSTAVVPHNMCLDLAHIYTATVRIRASATGRDVILATATWSWAVSVDTPAR